MRYAVERLKAARAAATASVCVNLLFIYILTW
jgi:hypothetical protein